MKTESNLGTTGTYIKAAVGSSCWWICAIFEEKNYTSVLKIRGIQVGRKGFQWFCNASREKRALELSSFELIKLE